MVEHSYFSLSQYYVYTFIALATKPVLLWCLINFDRSEYAENFAIFIIFQQILVACAGTQIHKRLMQKENMSTSLLVRCSTLEGLILALPAGVIMGFYFSDIYFFFASILILPFEKVFDDYQRDKIYRGHLSSHGKLSAIRAGLLILAVIPGLIFKLDNSLLTFYCILAMFAFFKLNSFRSHDLSLWRLLPYVKKMATSITGICWSLFCVYLMQLDKFALQLTSNSLANYMLTYQVLVIAHMGFAIAIYNRYRTYARKKINFYITKNATGLAFFTLVLGGIYIFLSQFGMELGIAVIHPIELQLQVIIVLNMMLLIIVNEIVFWRYKISKLLITDGTLLVIGLTLAYFIAQTRLEVIIYCLLLMLIRTLCYLIYTGLALRRESVQKIHSRDL